MHFDNNGSINKISSRNRCTRYTRFILGKPSWGRKTQQAFSFRVSSTMSSRQTLACLRNEPRRVKVLSLVQEPKYKQDKRTKYQIPRYKVSSSLVRKNKSSALPRRERATQQSVSYEWNRICEMGVTHSSIYTSTTMWLINQADMRII